jgi:hypothetical protein
VTTTLARVRVVGGGLDPLSARQRLEGVLAGVELRPPGLAPAALLFVRRVAGLPQESMTLEPGCLRPPRQWESAFVGALEQALHDAAHPAQGAVPAAVGAVVFADRSELLACLARDALDGTAAMRWWWHRVLARAGMLEGTIRLWRDDPRHVPAALELLAAWSLAPAFVAALPGDAVGDLTAGVVREFALPESGDESAVAAPPTAAVRVETDVRPAAPAPAPWNEVAPEADDHVLDPAGQLLLGLALALRRAPTLSRTPAFAQALRMWEAEASEREVSPRVPSAPERRFDPPPAPTPFPGQAEGDGDRTSDVRSPDRLGRRTQAAGSRRAEPTLAAEARRDIPPVPDVPLREDEVAMALERSVGRQPSGPRNPAVPPTMTARNGAPPCVPIELAPAPHAPGARASAAGSQPPPARAWPGASRPLTAYGGSPIGRSEPAPPPTRPAPAEQASGKQGARCIDCGLGGLFYLLNLALQLDLYGDFTRPREPGIALSPWDLVELLGLRLLGERPDDPVWELLASLACRPVGSPSGATFRPPPDWRVPPAWLEPLDGAGAWRWSAAGGVLRVAHPAGFAAIAVARIAVPATTQLCDELARYRRLARRPSTPAAARVRDELVALTSPTGAPRRAALPREPTRPLRRWIARLAAYAEARLRAVLALDPDEPIHQTFIRRRARVFVSPTHVDVVLKLAELPIYVRIAGLDRTPGWIPATGRHVAFHFE